MKLPLKSSSNKRPFGVLIIILTIIANILLIAVIFYLSLSPPVSNIVLQLMNITNNYQINSIYHYQVSIILILSMAIQLVIVIGLWRLQRWAWLLLILWVGIQMVYDLWGYFNDQHLRTLSMIIDVLIVFYMNQREVKKAFSGKTLMGVKWTT